MRLLARGVRIAAVLADLGEAGVSQCRRWIGLERGLEFALGLKDKPAVQELNAIFHQRIGLRGRGKGGEAHGLHLFELKGGLAEAGLAIGSLDALEGQGVVGDSLAGVGIDLDRCGILEHGGECLCFGVLRVVA